MVALHPDLSPQPHDEAPPRKRSIWHERYDRIMKSDLAHGPWALAVAIHRIVGSKEAPRLFATDETLGSLARYSRGTVIAHRQELERIGFLERTGRRPDGRVEYAVRFDALRIRPRKEAKRNEAYHEAREEAARMEAEIVRTETCSPDEAHAYMEECGVVGVDAVMDLYSDEDVERAVVETMAATKARKVRNRAGYLAGILKRMDPTRWARYVAIRAERAMRRRGERGPGNIGRFGAEYGIRTPPRSESEHIQPREVVTSKKKNIGGSVSEEGRPSETETRSDATAIHVSSEAPPRTSPRERTSPLKLMNVPHGDRKALLMEILKPEGESGENAAPGGA